MLRKQDEVNNLIKKYLELANKTFYIKSAFLFGSYAKGNPNSNSDIDLALVSPDFEDIPNDVVLRMLLRMARSIDSSIEPIALTESEINSPQIGSIAYDVMKTGTLIKV